MSQRIKAAIFNNGGAHARVYADGRREQLAELVDLYPDVVTSDSFDRLAPELADIEAIISTWGMPSLSASQLDCLPALKAVFYGAGSVQGFARTYLERGIVVVSAWAANAVPVAEFTVAQILLANKGYFRNVSEYKRAHHGISGGPGNFGEIVSLLGVGQIGRKVVELLSSYNLRVIVYDPYLSQDDAVAMGVERVSLAEAFTRGLTVSNHLANIPATVGMLRRELFESMRPNATFINTGRGATIVEADLIDVLTRRGDITALLDVTDPEPPVQGSPLYELLNVFLSSHIAGSIGDEVVRMADYVLDELRRWLAGEPLRYAVTLEMLSRMA
jgi:phosphoglycerate dehydrogenase-like enzyme